ncbi:hypothetical protein HDU93_006460 [Gonapodya sp. JEL0774]|nr:hypothetical protein HDU93_006460 [Gonapodya sp. JEL0774]
MTSMTLPSFSISSLSRISSSLLPSAFSQPLAFSLAPNTAPRLARSYLTRKGPPKIVTPTAAVSTIPSHSRIYVHGVAAHPTVLTTALSLRTDLRHVELCHLHLETPNPCAKEDLRDSFFVNNLFIGANMRSAVDKGYSSYVPMFLSEVGSSPKRQRRAQSAGGE